MGSYRGAVVLCRRLLALVVALLLVTGCSSATSPPPAPPSSTRAASSGPTATAPSAPATRPSRVPGVVEVPSAGWRVQQRDAAFGVAWKERPVPSVEGFADQASVAPGRPVVLYVSSGSAQWRVTAYRMGWYGGKRGAQVCTAAGRPVTGSPAPATWACRKPWSRCGAPR